MLDVLEKFHKLGFLHRDIKPSNFMVKDEEVYLTDFGTTVPYIDDQGNHIKEQQQPFFGTVEYASIRTHQNSNQSRKDDLETLGYSILDIMTEGKISFLSVDRSVFLNAKGIDPALHFQQINLKQAFIKTVQENP